MLNRHNPTTRLVNQWWLLLIRELLHLRLPQHHCNLDLQFITKFTSYKSRTFVLRLAARHVTCCWAQSRSARNWPIYKQTEQHITLYRYAWSEISHCDVIKLETSVCSSGGWVTDGTSKDSGRCGSRDERAMKEEGLGGWMNESERQKEVMRRRQAYKRVTGETEREREREMTRCTVYR